MKNSIAMKLGGFTALVSTSILGSVTAANAANIDGCGLEPDGATLENNAGVCELTFDTAGTYSWTLPAGIADLYAVLVGAGGGAAYVEPNTGYAGAGGGVMFLDLTDWVADDTATINVGAGGESGSPSSTAGEDTSLRGNGGSPLSADGGNGGDISDWGWGFCDGGFFGENTGAGDAGGAPAGGACSGGGPGIIPDSDADAPAIFDGFTAELGHGGGAYLDRTHNARIGEGANIFYQTGDNATTADLTGSDGAVIFRFTASDANNVTGSGAGSGSHSGSDKSLAYTGNDVPIAATALASVALMAAGIGAVAFGRRRKQTSH